jgi:hypothetical protein
MNANKTICVRRRFGQLAPYCERLESTTRLEHDANRVGDDLDDDLHHGPKRELAFVVASVK